MKIKLIIIILLLFSTYCYSAIINVPQDYPLIQEAINQSANGDTILVSNGTYNESIDFVGKQITVASNFIISNNPEDIASTIIDANGASFHVVKFVNGESADSKLVGLSITGGNANGSEGSDRGGGIYVDVNNSEPTIDYCYIYDNSALGAGGGIALEAFAGEVQISNCKIYDNQAVGGAGLYLGSIVNTSLIDNCEIFNNTADEGGAIINLLTQSIISNSSIFSNTASQNGNAIMAFSGLVIDKTTIYDNTSNAENIIFLNAFDANREPLIITNSTIVNNGIAENNTITLAGSSKLAIVNSIISNFSEIEISANQADASSQIDLAFSNIVRGQNSLEVAASCELNWAESNISNDPLFIAQADNNFGLTENSPCIDTGTDNFEYNGTLILSLSVDDYVGTAPDMGCNEFENLDSNDSGSIIPHNIQLFNYPNPFNPSTTIDYSIQSAAYLELQIFNARGQKIKSLQKGYVEGGNHSVVWDGRNDNNSLVASGVYFYHITAGNEQLRKKMILMK